MADMRRYSAGFIKPDDVRDGPRQEKIVNVYVSEKFNRPVLVFESGDEFTINQSNARALSKVFGFDDEGWRQKTVELSLGTYIDKEDGQTKETVVLKTISSRDSSGGGNGSTSPTPPTTTLLPPKRDDIDDSIPF
jgi:hypothetical protein